MNDLEAVFRSQELSRVAGSGSGGRTFPEDREDVLLRRMFGHGSSARGDFHRDDERSSAGREAAALASERRPRRRPRVEVRPPEKRTPPVSAEPPWRRGSGRYWTIAAVSALAALVVAGVTADTGQQEPSNRSAQGAHETARPARRGRSARCRLHGADCAGLAHRSGWVRRPGPGSDIGRSTPFGQWPGRACHARRGGHDDGNAAASPPMVRRAQVARRPARRVRAEPTQWRRWRPVSAAPLRSSGTPSPASRINSGVPFPPRRRRSSTVSSAVSGVLNSVDQAVDATTL